MIERCKSVISYYECAEYLVFFNSSEAGEWGRKINEFESVWKLFPICFIDFEMTEKTVYSCLQKSEVMAVKEEPSCDLN